MREIVCTIRIPYYKDCVRCPLWNKCRGKASNKQIEKWIKELKKKS